MKILTPPAPNAVKYMRAISKVNSSELLTKQTMRTKYEYRVQKIHTYILKLLLNRATARIEAPVVFRNRFVYVCAKHHDATLPLLWTFKGQKRNKFSIQLWCAYHLIKQVNVYLITTTYLKKSERPDWMLRSQTVATPPISKVPFTRTANIDV